MKGAKGFARLGYLILVSPVGTAAGRYFPEQVNYPAGIAEVLTKCEDGEPKFLLFSAWQL